MSRSTRRPSWASSVNHEEAQTHARATDLALDTRREGAGDPFGAVVIRRASERCGSMLVGSLLTHVRAFRPQVKKVAMFQWVIWLLRGG
jgi:hypothetical protein